MKTAENGHFIFTNNHKTIERFGNPGRDSGRMREIFAFHFDTVDQDPKTFLIHSHDGHERDIYFTNKDLQNRHKAAQKDPSVREALLTEAERALENARYALIIYEPLPAKKPSFLSSRGGRRKLGEER